MAEMFRKFYQHQQGRIRKNFNHRSITERSTVIITAAQWRPTGGTLEGASRGRYFLGDADISVSNIGPHNDEGGGTGGVEFILHVGSTTPIDVVVTFAVLDPYRSFFS